MALWRLFYHLVWATDERRPLIQPAIEPILYGYLIGKATALGSIVHALGGIENHVHLVASVPPKLAIAEFVQKVKGSSSHYLNHGPQRFDLIFAWQRGYGVFSLGARQLEEAIAYVQQQKQHHRKDSLIDWLERDQQEDDGPTPWQEGQAVAQIKVIHPQPAEVFESTRG